MVHKTCSWGLCKSDSRRKKEDMKGVTFRKFPQPKTQRERCMEWINRCNRPHEQLNVDRIGHYHYICSKHFEYGAVDPVSACTGAKTLMSRKTRPRSKQAKDSDGCVAKEQQIEPTPVVDASSRKERHSYIIIGPSKYINEPEETTACSSTLYNLPHLHLLYSPVKRTKRRSISTTVGVEDIMYTVPLKKSKRTTNNAVTMKAVRFTNGNADSLYIGEALLPEPKEKEVRIHVITTAINRADTLQRRGLYPSPPGASDVLGLEAAGVVDKLGPGCPSSITVGQRVMALLAGGGNAQYVTCPYQQLIPVPDKLSWEEAAAIPEVWLTAFQLLYTVGHLQAEDSVLIHAGGSGVGTAAVQLVKQAGAAAIVSAGSQEKIDLAVSLGAVTGVNYKQGSVGNKVLDLTGGKGVNLILDCVGASMFEENVKSIATDGRWVFYGALGGSQLNMNMLPILQKRITLTGSTLRSRPNEYKASLVAKFTSYAIPLFESGVLRPIISSVLPWTKIAEAHKIMEANQNLGKIVLRVSEEDYGVKEESVEVKEEL